MAGMTGSILQLVDYWTLLWQRIGGAPLLEYLIVAVSVAAAVLATIGQRRLWPRKPRGFHYGKQAAAWAHSRFPEEQRPIAAYVAQLMCEQFGVSLAHLEPSTHIIDDLGMVDLEPVEFLMALETDLAIAIPEKDGAENLATLGGVVEYLHTRVEVPNSVEDSSSSVKAANPGHAEV
jgi:acyl carrier protein